MAAFVQPAFVFGAFVETKSLKELRQQSEHAGGGRKGPEACLGHMTHTHTHTVYKQRADEG